MAAPQDFAGRYGRWALIAGASEGLGAAFAREAARRGLDVVLVVYNAAYSPIGSFLELPVDAQLRAVDVNVRGPIAMAHGFGRRLPHRGRGGIVLLSSLTAFQGSPFVATYGATKSFALALAEALWLELAPAGVDVLAVCTGATRTPAYLRRAGRRAPGELEPDQVAREAFDRLADGPLMIPGRFNRMASWAMRRLLPRRTTIRIMGAQTHKLTRAI